MRNKGAILTLVVALTLVCIYQLSFTLKAISVNNLAKEHAQGDPVKEEKYIDSISNEIVFDILIKELQSC